MKVRQGPARAALLCIAATAALTLVSAGPAAAAATPPYEPDSGAAGAIVFYDSAGSVVTSGSTSTLVSYAVGTAALTATGNKASLYGYLPKSGQVPGAFSGELLSGPTTYPISGSPSAVSGSANPAVKGVTGDLTFANLATDFPNTATDAYKGLYQIRIKTTDAKYLASDISITGTTWVQVYPATGVTPVPEFNLGTNVIAAGQHTKVLVSGMAGDVVDVLVKGAASSTYTKLASLTLNSLGASSLIVTPSTTSSYEVRNATGTSAAKSLLVKAVQSLVVTIKGRVVTFTGHIAPSLVGRTVTVYDYVKGGHTLTACTTKTTSGGQFKCGHTFTAAGTYYTFAQTNADRYNAAGRSSLHTDTIR